MWPRLTQVGEQPPALLCSGGYSPIYARRRSSVIDLRDLTDGEDQVGITPQEQLLQAAHLSPVPLLRRAKDPLLEPLHHAVGCGPVDAGPSAFLLALDRGRVCHGVYLLVQSCRFGSVCFISATASEKSAPFQVGYFHAMMALFSLFFRDRRPLFPASFTPERTGLSLRSGWRRVSVDVLLNRYGAYRVPRSRGTLGVGSLPLRRRESGPVDALSTLGASSPACHFGSGLEQPLMARYLMTTFSHGSSLSLALSQLSLARLPTVMAGRSRRLPQLQTVDYSSACANLKLLSDGCMGACPQDGSEGLLTSSL